MKETQKDYNDRGDREPAPLQRKQEAGMTQGNRKKKKMENLVETSALK